jgi:hypothetical protein
MSQVEMYIVKTNGDVIFHKEFQNSHGFASRIWSDLWKKYMPHCSEHSWLYDDRLFQLHKSGSPLSDDEKIVLFSTYDRVVFEKAFSDYLIWALLIFEKKYPAGSRVSHLGEIAKTLMQLKNDDDVIGFCFNATTISCDFWRIYKNEEDEESETISYNIFRNKNHDWIGDNPA